MKKMILILMLVIGSLTFAEKLTSDGKLHADKLVGVWMSGMFEIKKQKGQYYFITHGSEGRTVHKLTPYGKNMFKLQRGDYLAYDTKYKEGVLLDENFEIFQHLGKEACKHCN